MKKKLFRELHEELKEPEIVGTIEEKVETPVVAEEKKPVRRRKVRK